VNTSVFLEKVGISEATLRRWLRGGSPVPELLETQRDWTGKREWTDAHVAAVLRYKEAKSCVYKPTKRTDGPTCIDLFSGAGGFSVGFSESGFRVLAAIEMQPVFCKTHAVNFPTCLTLERDLSSYTPDLFLKEAGLQRSDVDVIIGSPPCQTFSTIGVPKINSLKNGNAATDPRNYLFHAYIDYVEALRPRAFVFENVPSMRAKHKGVLFDRMLRELTTLGYDLTAGVLNSADYGVPQLRNRLIVVGVRKGMDFSFPSPTHGPPEPPLQGGLFSALPAALKPYVTVGEAVSDLPQIQDGNRDDELPYVTSVATSDYQRLVRNKTNTVRNNICRVSNDRAKRVFPHMAPGSKYMDLPAAVRQILPFREDIFHDRLKRLDATKPSWTVLAHIGMDGYMYIHPSLNRTLSVREAARIQSFPDDFIFVGNMREQYVQVGNAVPPLLSQHLATAVAEALCK
jgi:DNA (cytosine-5)-methyltransferase 1